MTQSKIVILEADQHRRDYIKSIVSDRGYIPYIFEKETICLDNLLPLDPDLVISGPLSNERVSRFVNTVKMKNYNLPVLILSGDRNLRDSAASNGFGGVRVIKVNFKPAEIKSAINNLLRERISGSGKGDSESTMIIGNSPEILKIKRLILDLKASREPVLVQGEPGSGKELVIRALHYHSNQPNLPFIKINMSGLDSLMLNAIFFKILPSNYVHSGQNNHGTPLNAGCGTVLLDEIEAFPVSHQSSLLKIFEDGCFQQNRPVPTEMNRAGGRIISSSNSLLEPLVRRGTFRRDLFYRLNVISINIPPLRERAGDIPMLMDFFADKFCMELGVGHIEISSRLKDIFCSYHWPGNVRELKSTVRKVILYGNKDRFVKELAARWAKYQDAAISGKSIYALAGFSDLKNYLRGQNNLTLKNICRVYLQRTEKTIIKLALKQTNWNRKKAADLLNISYKSLLNKIKDYHLN
ncbi:MAG: sigma-54-dependent Fis family transcriptional regulator [bacterium]|nr:sigma-54-dependent Fis family transcriptional regulator [bacterium]